jgi:hypothetical protein
VRDLGKNTAFATCVLFLAMLSLSGCTGQEQNWTTALHGGGGPDDCSGVATGGNGYSISSGSGEGGGGNGSGNGNGGGAGAGGAGAGVGR